MIHKMRLSVVVVAPGTFSKICVVEEGLEVAGRMGGEHSLKRLRGEEGGLPTYTT